MRRIHLAALLVTGCLAGATPGAAASSTPALFHSPAVGLVRTASYWTSDNWSGYAGPTGKRGSARFVSGYWVVPKVSRTARNTFSSTWLGIDGFGINKSLIQTGTDQAWVGGHAQYGAWWEILPKAQTNIPSVPVKPGDQMFAEIYKMKSGKWFIGITDTTTKRRFTISRSYSGPADTVEWIQEAPTVNGRIATLAHYGKTHFVKDGLDRGPVGFSAADRGVMIQNHKRVSTPSLPDKARDGFAVAYGPKRPPPPKS